MIDSTRFKDLAVSETGFIFDPYSGATFTVNETGLAIVMALREGSSTSDIVDRLKRSFDAVTPEVKYDVGDFFRALKQQCLLPEEFDIQ
jgi:hypothetical protein